VLAAGVVALGVAASLWPRLDDLGRVGIDLLLPAAARLAKARPQSSEIALVVIDEATHRRPPFSETPEVAWTPYLATVLDAVGESGAEVVGLDIVYPKTLSGPELLPGFDRPFLAVLYEFGRDGRLVLGEVRLSAETIAPYEGQIQAVGGWDNVRPLHFTPDADGVVRGHADDFALDDGARVASLANELVKRSGRPPAEAPVLIDFLGALSVPVYRFSDIHHCAERDRAALRPLFQDRIVLVGTWLDVEDRHPAANRFVDPNQPPILDVACAPLSRALGRPVHRQRVPGVLIHALAVETILNRSAPAELGRITEAGVTLVLLAALSAGFLLAGPIQGVVLLLLSGAALWAGAVALFLNGVVVPYLLWGSLAVTGYILLYSYRVVFEDREKRWIRHAFRHYLSPHLVNQLSRRPELLKLGGERRDVSVMFLDLAGFTALSERLRQAPEIIVSVLNDELGRFADIIEFREGYVDKFVGEAVMAVWGAPVPCATPERQAAATALDCQTALAAQARRDEGSLTALRIGLAAGEAVAGNIGSTKRFNYTVIGDTVNLASRLEGANRTYGTSILASEALAAALGDDIVTRLVDKVVVAGRAAPVTIYEIVGFRQALSPKLFARLDAFARARALYLERDFEAAGRAFAELAVEDPVARLYAERAGAYREMPPAEDWDGTETLAAK